VFRAATFSVSFAAFLMVEMLIYQMLSGDPFYRFHALSSTHNTNGDVVAAESSYQFAQLTYWNLCKVIERQTGSLPVLLIAGAVWVSCIVRRTPLSFLALTGSFGSFYLIFGSSSFSRLIALPVQDRYFQIAVPFLAVSVSELVTYLGGLARRRTPEYIV